MNEKSAAQAFEKKIRAVSPVAPEQLAVGPNDVPDEVQIAAALRFLGAEWGHRTPSSLRHTIALLQCKRWARIVRRSCRLDEGACSRLASRPLPPRSY